jgi:hypothetical protein
VFPLAGWIFPAAAVLLLAMRLVAAFGLEDLREDFAFGVAGVVTSHSSLLSVKF